MPSSDGLAGCGPAGSDAAAASAPVSGITASMRGSLTTKVAPRASPGLSAATVPPCSSTRLLTRASPRPSPPRVRVVELSPCRKRSNTYGRKSAAMPTPLSLTAICTWEFTRWSWTCTRPAFGVNFTALLRRFHITCRKRSGSPLTGPPGDASTVCSSMPLASAAGRMLSTVSTITVRRSTGLTSSRTCPVPMRETSSRSSISRTCALTFRRMICSARRDWSAGRSPRSSSVAHPKIALSGARSSCDRAERNWSLARLAASAAARPASAAR